MQGSLTLRLKDIPWDQALDIILQTKGLDMRKNGNVVLIAPREELALKEKQQLENALQIAQLEPLISESFQLNYIKASDLQNMITTNRQQQFGAGAGQTATTGGQGSILSQRGVAFVDPRSNILFVQDTAAVLEEVRKIIRLIDTPIRQVLIEARIVIASDTFSRQLGVRFGQQTGFTFGNRRYAGGFERQLEYAAGGHVFGDDMHARDADADAFRTGVGHRVGRLFGFAAAERQPARAQPGRPARADTDQPGQRQPHQPRALGAGGRWTRQSGVEPARGDRRTTGRRRSSRERKFPT